MSRIVEYYDPEDSAAANAAYAASLYQPSVAKPTAAEIMKMVTGLLPNPNNLQLSDAMAAMKTEAAAKPPTGAEIMKMVTGLLPNPNNLQMSDALAALKTEAAVTPTGLLSTTPAPTSAEIGKMLVGLLPNPNNLTSADMAAAATREGILNPTVSAATVPAATVPAATNLLTGSGIIVDDTVGPVNTRGVNTGVITAPAKTEAELNQERMDLISQVNHVNVGNEQTKVATQDIAAATTGIPQRIIDKMNATGAPVLENGVYYQPIYGDERGSGETYERGSPTSYVSYSESENKAGGAYTTHDLTGKEIGTGVQQEVETGLKSALPVIQAALMMTGAGGLLGNALLGSGANQVAASALGGSLLGGGSAAIGGGDILKGAVLGGAGGALSTYLSGSGVDSLTERGLAIADAQQLASSGLSASEISQVLSGSGYADAVVNRALTAIGGTGGTISGTGGATGATTLNDVLNTVGNTGIQTVNVTGTTPTLNTVLSTIANPDTVTVTGTNNQGVNTVIPSSTLSYQQRQNALRDILNDPTDTTTETVNVTGANTFSTDNSGLLSDTFNLDAENGAGAETVNVTDTGTNTLSYQQRQNALRDILNDPTDTTTDTVNVTGTNTGTNTLLTDGGGLLSGTSNLDAENGAGAETVNVTGTNTGTDTLLTTTGGVTDAGVVDVPAKKVTDVTTVIPPVTTTSAVTTVPPVVTTPTVTDKTLTRADVLDSVKLALIAAGLLSASGEPVQSGYDIVPIPTEWKSPEKTSVAAFTPYSVTSQLPPIDFGDKNRLVGTQWEKFLSPTYGQLPAPKQYSQPSSLSYSDLMGILGSKQGMPSASNLSINDVISGIQNQYGQTTAR